MTSLCFILGVISLPASSGPALVRKTPWAAVTAGMITATVAGLFFILVYRIGEKGKQEGPWKAKVIWTRLSQALP